MSSQKVRLIISTNTNIRFLTALPAAFTIDRALPLILSRYQTVVAQNLEKDHALLRGQEILSLTKKGCLVARDEVIGEVFSDNDEISINIGHDGGTIEAPRQPVDVLSKLQKLEIKKKQKAATVKQAQQPPKTTQSSHPDKKVQKHEKPTKKTQPQESKQHKSTDALASKATDYLSKFRSAEKEDRSHKPSQPESNSKPAPRQVRIIDDESDDE